VADIEEIRDDLFRLRLPMPGTPSEVNVYLIRTASGAVLIDAGWNSRLCRTMLAGAMGRIGRSPSSVQAILVTHGHIDHMGLAGWIADVAGGGVWLHPRDHRFVVRWIEGDGLDEAWGSFLSGSGMPLADIDEIRAAASGWRLPAPVRLVSRFPSAAVEASIAPVWTPGHTPGHACFMLGDLVFTGDHLLPRITPNIAKHAGSGPNPLGDYLRSLSVIEDLGAALVLPGHGDPFGGMHDRIGEIRAHHQTRTTEILAAIDSTPRTARDVAVRVSWKRGSFDRLRPLDKELAIYETAAHLAHCEEIGLVASERPSGISFYREG
jgi:glyoxylase-like metal-dependent hydrolase (beta-lactamase superfamily II)